MNNKIIDLLLYLEFVNEKSTNGISYYAVVYNFDRYVIKFKNKYFILMIKYKNSEYADCCYKEDGSIKHTEEEMISVLNNLFKVFIRKKKIKNMLNE